jgi:hypothetical protein
MRVLVVTDAISTGAYFPAWYAYYIHEFGAENIHVFTYPEHREEFSAYLLGGIHVLEEGYDDDVRMKAITAFVETQLQWHDAVIRVDVDEFILADPDKFPNLLSYLKTWNGSHLTAYGFDVIQSLDEPEIDLTKPLLEQRRFAYALNAMNKTCVARVPLKWSRGFHYCSLPPCFGELFLLHMKRADIDMQAAWNASMREKVATDKFASKHYSWERDNILDYHQKRFKMEIVDGIGVLRRSAFNQNFLKNIRFARHNRIFEGPFDIEEVNIVIPDSVRTLF